MIADTYFIFFNDTATTEIYTLSLHDALPICPIHGLCRPRDARADHRLRAEPQRAETRRDVRDRGDRHQDRKSTRLNSSHANISYAVFCLKKKKTTTSSSCMLPSSNVKH